MTWDAELLPAQARLPMGVESGRSQMVKSDIAFFVPGIPVPKGSARGFVINGRAIITHDNAKTRPWESLIRGEVRGKLSPDENAPVRISAEFVFPRPKYHFKANGEMKDFAIVAQHTNKPDLDKLMRSLLDALTSFAWRDDSQVCEFGKCSKRYAMHGEEPGAHVRIEVLKAALDR